MRIGQKFRDKKCILTKNKYITQFLNFIFLLSRQTVGNSSRKERQTVNTFIYYDIKKFKEDIEIEICSYSPITFLHKHRHIVQTSCKKDSNGKHTEDRTMLFFSFLFFEKKKGNSCVAIIIPCPMVYLGKFMGTTSSNRSSETPNSHTLQALLVSRTYHKLQLQSSQELEPGMW